MEGEPTGFWGKLEFAPQRDRVARWHPLVDHCADVAAVAETLLAQTLLGRRLARLAGRSELTPTDVARLSFIAALHDIGKFNVGFQNKGFPDRMPKRGHVIEGLELLGDAGYEVQQRFLSITRLGALAAPWGQEILPLLVAAIGHHGRPEAIPSGLTADAWTARHGLDPVAGIGLLADHARTWFPDAFVDDSPLPSGPAFQHAFSGLVMLADWLGSDRKFFDYSRPGDPPRIATSRLAAAAAITAMGLVPGPARAKLGAAPPTFERVSAFAPRAMQRAIMELPTLAAGSLTILESETGSGKTEAALVRYLRLFQAGLVDGLYFALPTRTAATQLHLRVLAAAQRAFDSAAPPVVLAVPGYLRVDDDHGSRLTGFEVLWNDVHKTPDQGAAHARGWAAESPKRFLVGAIAVGTIDQVLLSSLTVDHAHLRATALLRHLLVVDEVHASDAYMTRILEEVLDTHLAAGGHALLMSATLGTATQARLLRSAVPSRSRPPHVQVPALEDALAVPYPSIAHRPVGDLPYVRMDVADAGSPKAVGVVVADLAEEPSEVARRALDAAGAGALVIVIRNTVADCVATQRAAERLAGERGERGLLFSCAGVPAPHHARYAREDREALDHELERRFGKHANRATGCVVVATQTVQQSLDLDADFLITDLCPADVLLQRIGRLHRHDQRIGRLHRHDRAGRPDGFATPRALVLGHADLGSLLKPKGDARARHGLGNIYEDLRMLEATRRLIVDRPTWRIPEMNRELVERTTHPAVLDALARELGDPWPAHAAKVTSELLAKRRLGSLNVVQRNEELGQYQFPSDGRRIQSRLGESDRLIEVDEPQLGPFEERIRRWRVPEWMARGCPSEATGGARHVGDGVLELTLSDLVFRYDRLGLRRWEDEEEESDADE